MIHSLVIGLTLAITSGREFGMLPSSCLTSVLTSAAAPLVTAIIFHQLFEGLSLGIRIAGLPPAPTFPSSVPSPELPLPVHSPPASYSKQNEDESDRRGWATHWLSPTLSILFAITTPLGIILGMFVFASGKSGTSAEQTARMHLTQGLMSGISAGMLIYAATVEMLAGDFVYGDVGGDHGQLHDHDHGHAAHEHVHTHGDDSTMGSGRRKVVAVGSLVAGVLTMGLVGLGE
ncbi:hypothetical protein H0H81_009481 [Sphagnurus paluster]|uniref:Uncharacterized protein n=1 Tax=Sphagnurus paluster TaxID=117069 RepID=A0A9P7FVS2_9AGAR|nr:hypothetical protein H0H81_009481 [Sphagnurus paluster]